MIPSNKRINMIAPYDMYIRNEIIIEPKYASKATAPKKSTIFPYSDPVNIHHNAYKTTIATIIPITYSPF